MNRAFLYTFFFFILVFVSYSQKTNYDSILQTLPDLQQKYDFLHKELRKAGTLSVNDGFAISKKKLEYAMDLNDTGKIASSYNDIGNQYLDVSDYSAALNYYLKGIKFYESKKDSLGIAMEYENISLIYSAKEDYLSAKRFILRAIKILKKHTEVSNYYSTLANLGDIYRNQNRIDSAFYFYNLVIKNTKDSSELAIVYNNIGLYYLKSSNIDSALVFLNISNEIDKSLDNKINYAISLSNLADCYVKKGEVKKALADYRTAISLSRQLKDPELISGNYASIADAFALLKQFDSAHYYLNKYTGITDSLRNSSSEQQLADLRSGFDREAQEKELKIQQLEAEKKEKESKDIITSFIIASLFLVTIIGFAVFRYKAKQKSYDNLKLLNNEVTTQKILVEEKQKEIVDSITYARRIQRPLLAKEEDIKQEFSDCFILFKPKDIVSGDFYWSTRAIETTEAKDLFYLAVCDSTGHGVPGAFMSLLNIGFLSEAIKEKHIEHTDGIFNYVRERLVESISDDGQKDGFDGIILCVNKAAKKLEYCSAQNPPLFIRENEFLDMPCDKMPVGKGERTQSFTEHSVDLKKGDMIYLYTDGYADQFGGPKGKKYKYKKLSELLMSIHSKSLVEQKNILENEFETWKGDLEQVDDVTVIGLRI